MSMARLEKPKRVGPARSDPATIRGMLASILKMSHKSAGPINKRFRLRSSRRRRNPLVLLRFLLIRRGRLLKSCLIRQPNLSVIMTVDGVSRLFINADALNTRRLNKGQFKDQIITVGIINPADYMAFNIGDRRSFTDFFVEWDKNIQRFRINLTGDHNIYNALFAIAMADQLGFKPTQIERGLRRFRRTGRRRY